MPSASTEPAPSTNSTGKLPGDENEKPKAVSAKERVKELLKPAWSFITKSLERVGYKVKRKENEAPQAEPAPIPVPVPKAEPQPKAELEAKPAAATEAAPKP